MKKSFFLTLLLVMLAAGMLLPSLASEHLGGYLMKPFLQRLSHYYVTTSAHTAAYWLSLQSEEQRPEAFAQVKSLYPVEIQMTRTDQLSHLLAHSLSDNTLNRLSNGELIFLDQSEHFIIGIPDSDQILILLSPDKTLVNITTDAEAESMGTLALLQRRFQNQPEQQWPKIMAETSALFPYPVTLLSIQEILTDQHDSIRLNAYQKEALQQGRAVAVSNKRNLMNYGSGLDYFMQRLDNSNQVLVAGPASLVVQQQLDRYQLISQGSMSLLVLLLLSLWLLPTWRASRSLINSARRFAMGQMPDRARRYRFSHFHPVTDTFNRMAEDIEADFKANQRLIQTLSREMDSRISGIETGLNQLEKHLKSTSEADTTSSVSNKAGELPEACTEQQMTWLIEKEVDQLSQLTSDALIKARQRSEDTSFTDTTKDTTKPVTDKTRVHTASVPESGSGEKR
ncbi:hypothetical protein [Oceanospirillum sediminis]|uniref:Uncharacterized protein n=1 Tax=Oceanospirillum sediminis TaxID=2760088 RepID=A0A839IVD2_9GAMM|nr:hypothetical protein [Oceanospirillum sediminis]MBB1488908.1 hypothetical protein [Oceanospirillum sediminis]